MGMRNDAQKVAATLCGNEHVSVRWRVDHQHNDGASSRTMPQFVYVWSAAVAGISRQTLPLLVVSASGKIRRIRRTIGGVVMRRCRASAFAVSASCLRSHICAARRRCVCAPGTARSRCRGVFAASASHALITKYCIGCHNERLRTGGLALDRLDSSNPGEHAQVWETVVEKLRAGSMPPPGRPRPEPAAYAEAAAELERALDRAWAATPDPGRIGAVHRSEPHRVQQRHSRFVWPRPRRRLAAARRRNRRRQFRQFCRRALHFDRAPGALHVGRAANHAPRHGVCRLRIPRSTRSRFRCTATQDDRQSEDLPLGSRGGISVRYHFPVDGEYRSRSVCSATIRTTSRGWAGSSCSTCGSTASC